MQYGHVVYAVISGDNIMWKCVISILNNLLIVDYYAENYGNRREKYRNSMEMEADINRFLSEIGRMNTHKIYIYRYE